MISDCYIVGICGGTCSGKTTLSKRLHKEFEGSSIYLSQDSYYKDQSHKSVDEIKKHNFDHPESLDLELLHDHLMQLKRNKEIESPGYCFKTHARLNEVQIIQPAKIVIVEGILIFSKIELMNLFDLRVFVDVDADIRLIRRIKRDCLERGRNIDSVTEQYLKSVKPMHDQFVESYKQHSDLVLTKSSLEEQKLIINNIIMNNINHINL